MCRYLRMVRLILSRQYISKKHHDGDFPSDHRGINQNKPYRNFVGCQSRESNPNPKPRVNTFTREEGRANIGDSMGTLGLGLELS